MYVVITIRTLLSFIVIIIIFTIGKYVLGVAIVTVSINVELHSSNSTNFARPFPC